MKQLKVILFFSLLFISACGNNGGNTISDTPIVDTMKIGLIGPLTGDASWIGESLSTAAQLAVDKLNAQGGVNGKKVELIAEDGKCNGKDAANAFLKLKDIDAVDAVIVTCSPELLAIAPMSQEILLVSPSATAPSISDAGRQVFRLAPSDALQGKVGAMLMKEGEFEKVGILYVNHDYGAGLNKVLRTELGSKIITSETFDPDAKDFRTQLIKMKNAEAIYLAVFPKDAAIIMRQVKELGITAKMFASEGAKDPMILDNAEGLVLTVPSSKGNHYPAFAAAYKARYGKEPPLFSGEAYDAVSVIVQAAKNNPEDLVDGMQQVKAYDGVAGYVEFDEKGDVVKPYDLYQVQNKEFVLIGQ